jgi:hypothetical protein
MHGGKAQQVLAKAAERLAMEQDRAARAEVQIAHDPEVPPATRLAALKDILDRGGTVRPQEVNVTIAKWEQDIEGVLYDLPEDVVDAELIEDHARAIPPSDVDWADERLPSLLDDPPTNSRSGPRLKG